MARGWRKGVYLRHTLICLSRTDPSSETFNVLYPPTRPPFAGIFEGHPFDRLRAGSQAPGPSAGSGQATGLRPSAHPVIDQPPGGPLRPAVPPPTEGSGEVPTSLEVENTAHTKQLGTAIVTALALTWLNPHVYLDTVVLLGSVAATYDTTRLWFGVGAAVASLAWFSALGYGAQFLRPLFSRPASWRVLDGAIAVFMLCLALTLAIQAIS